MLLLLQPMFTCMGKHRALSREVTCNFRLYFKLGRTSVNPSWTNWIFTSNYRCPHTGVPYNTAYGWNRPNFKAQCSLFTYTCALIQNQFICLT